LSDIPAEKGSNVAGIWIFIVWRGAGVNVGWILAEAIGGGEGVVVVVATVRGVDVVVARTGVMM
jgi:hypothetical protein